MYNKTYVASSFDGLLCKTGIIISGTCIANFLLTKKLLNVAVIDEPYACGV